MRREIRALLIAALVLAGPAQAVDYEIIAVDQIYDFDVFGQFTNPKARVLKKEDGRVLIQILEGDRAGEVEWVLPSKLLTLDESRKQELENVETGIGVGVAIICALAGGCDKEPGTIPETMPDGPDRNVLVQNKCDRDVSLWLTYYHDGRWLGGTAGWLIAAGKRTYLGLGNEKKLIADNDLVYLYAASTDGSKTWKGDSKTIVRLGDDRYDMRRVEMDRLGPDYLIALSCD
jgi:hypothetical protein